MTVLNTSQVNVVVPAQNMERAKQFYRDTLSLDINHEGPSGVLFSAGEGTQILVYPRPNGEPAEQTIATWEVDDLDGAVKELSKQGIDFEQYDMPNLTTNDRGIADMGDARAAWFKDSEGNTLAVSTRK